jgi:organic hydroperoxide reductase OsmC/OhrA
MLNISVDRARVHVRMRNKTEGSVLRGNVQASCLGFETSLEIESAEPAERIRELLRNAEHGCFTMQALQAPVAVARSATLNGAPLPLDQDSP